MNTLRMTLLSVAFVLGASFAPVVSAQQPGAQKSLYDRLGGLKGITVVVDDFINRLVANKQLNKNPAINAGRKSAPAPYLKFQVSQMVCGVTGGPCKYTGMDMTAAHKGRAVTSEAFGAVAEDLSSLLDQLKVPAKEKAEVMTLVGSLKPSIVQSSK